MMLWEAAFHAPRNIRIATSGAPKFMAMRRSCSPASSPRKSRTKGANDSKPVASSSCRSLTDMALVLVPDTVGFEVFDWLSTVVFDSIDGVLVRRAIPVGVPGHFFLRQLALFQERLGRFQERFRLINLLGRIVVPGVGLGLADLTPAPHLGQVPNGVAVERVVRLVTEEDVEVRHLPLVGLLEEEGARH